MARRSVELMKLLDDGPRERCHLIFLAQGSMNRQESDKWVRLALIREALQIAPGMAEAHEGLGKLLARMGRTDEAAMHLEEAVRLIK